MKIPSINEFFKTLTLHTRDKLIEFKDALTLLRYEGKASFGKNVKKTAEILSYLKQHALHSFACEEEVVFPFLEAHVPRLVPVTELFRSEHENVRQTLRSLGFSLWVFSTRHTEQDQNKLTQEIWDNGHYLIHLLQDRMRLKRESLFGVMQSELKKEEFDDLKSRILAWEKKTQGAAYEI